MPNFSAIPAISAEQVTLEWPSGELALDHLDAAFPPGRSGLVGLNGTGKSTLLRIIAGELAPSSGVVRRTGTVGYLPQDLPQHTGRDVADLLGITAIRDALRRIESGETDPDLYDAVGADWDVEERARAQLDALGLGRIELDRPAQTLSGGELILVALTGVLLQRPDVLLLDEPTNNLDATARSRLYQVIERWSGVLIIVSHDRQALRLVDQIAELRDGRVEVYGGNFDDYERQVAEQQAAAERDVRDARSDVNKQKQDWADAQVRLARRERYGRKMTEQKREPKIIMNARKRAAQESAGKYKGMHRDRLDEARSQLSQAQLRLRDDDEIKIELPATALPAARVVIDIAAPPGLVEVRDGTGPTPIERLIVRGPERIALTGDNGAGKTTLLRQIADQSRVPSQAVPQRLDTLADDDTVLSALTELAPHLTTVELRNRLAQLLLRGDQVSRPVRTLSGGQRLRAVLAAALLREPAPQLLMLDEPTNNLDLTSVAHLAQALRRYEGALIVVSHDADFLDEIEIDRWLAIKAQR
ncbi:ATP-binding cassette domain-containing protein [Epidermidibacterium keratini]|uniref:ATP-binding cassette domain-containing protein n=1 Tax=Epidermidibacterium keratini TaxID=1891644 RepID=A0A7L4YRH2_9ACTN|nr:ATP-binding cassette domain-containing protein [Epidermidibacterium keratini]QHC01167.1 ATP-binding cassette domain-containing protein [Epidermidibacterium keratini]